MRIGTPMVEGMRGDILVVDHGVSGKQLYDTRFHDARLVAAMIVHGITPLLTLDAGDFSRFPEITAVHPRVLVAARESARTRDADALAYKTVSIQGSTVVVAKINPQV
jgi:hypothetical protein